MADAQLDLFSGQPADRTDHFTAGASIPKKAHLPGIGHVRVTDYHGEGRFMVVDKKDNRRLVHRDRLTFLK